MRKRRRSRELALQVLYHWDVTGHDAAKTLVQLQVHFSPAEEKDEFAERIVQGVLTHREEIDRLVEQYSENWRLDRMTVIDRNLLRLATFELLYCDDIPPKVTLNEAIDLGKRFGSEESSGFINGILDRIQKEKKESPEFGARSSETDNLKKSAECGVRSAECGVQSLETDKKKESSELGVQNSRTKRTTRVPGWKIKSTEQVNSSRKKPKKREN